jgi:cell shape-determining protein MreD
MSKYWIFIKIFFLVILVLLIQGSVLNSFSNIVNRFNLFLFLTIWLFIFYDFRNSLSFALISGVILDIFSFYPFGIFTISFLLMVILADFVWNNFFTNRSIYSFLALSFILTLFYNLLLYLLLFLFEKNVTGVFWFSGVFWFNWILELIWVSLGIIISFYFLRQPKSRSNSLSFDKS